MIDKHLFGFECRECGIKTKILLSGNQYVAWDRALNHEMRTGHRDIRLIAKEVKEEWK